MSIKGGDNFDLLPDRLARDLETVFGITTKRCRTCLRAHKTGAASGFRRCGLLEKHVREDETCREHIER